ncbi:hypothetical protein DUNSADRAFT_3336, partial [Dunaliella salina]
SGVLPLITLLLFIAGEAIAFWPPCRDLPVLAQLYSTGIGLFRSELGVQAVMAAGATAHLIEAAITGRMCQKRGLKLSHICGWMGITLLVGYFGIHNLKRLSAKSR